MAIGLGSKPWHPSECINIHSSRVAFSYPKGTSLVGFDPPNRHSNFLDLYKANGFDSDLLKKPRGKTTKMSPRGCYFTIKKNIFENKQEKNKNEPTNSLKRCLVRPN